jgi:hypothetical protein
MGRVRTLPREVLTGTISQARRRFKQLKGRYSPQYTKAMLGAAFVALFSPIPGSVLVAVTIIVVIAEVHRAISQRRGLRKTSAQESVLSINCDDIRRVSRPGLMPHEVRPPI